MKKIYIIVNTNSSIGSGLEKWEQIRSIFFKRTITYDYDLTESRNHAALLAVKAIRNGYKTIIIAGGDGTINEAINGILIAGQENLTEIKIGIIPIGTGNDLCRSLEIPNNIEKAIDIIISKEEIKLDVGIVEFTKNERRKKRFFVNIAGLAFDSYVTEATNKIKERRTIKAINSGRKKTAENTYIKTLIKSLLVYKPIQMTIGIDNKEHFSESVFSMAVGIGKYNGNGMNQLPNAIVNDGYFDINIIKGVSKIRILKNISALFNGSIHKKKIVSMYRAKQVFVKTESLSLVETDGEILGHSPFIFNISDKQLSVFSPLDYANKY